MATILTQPRALRISWGAVFAGVVLSLVTVMILNLLGAGIGASALAPLKYQNPLNGFGYATGAWLLIVSVIAVVIGSYLAGRCAPVLGWLHGILAWGVMTMLVVYVAFSLAGSALNAAGNVAAVSANVAGQMAGAAANGAAANGDVNNGVVTNGAVQSNAQSLANAASQQLQQHGIDPNAPLQPQADAQLRVAADTAAHNVARATWWGFALLVLGAIIAAAAGNLGFRHQPLVEEMGGAAVVPTARVMPGMMRNEVDPLR
ncbi:YrzE family protein [Burkholderia sp. L27(2015)]|uniref:YrzE family protein n=1 Tax=Burkholderia sp. L27(2015) TaxID=1641858 RepID=UPI00131EC098|nr:YrzE family protein [Burkholderia sp. L27(2015)]